MLTERRISRRRRERGFGYIAYIILITLTTIAIGSMAMLAAKGAILSRYVRERDLVRMAAQQVILGSAPAAVGGSVAPDAPAAGWHDVVYADTETGGFTPLGEGDTAPAGAIVVRRQWRVSDSGGVRVFEVTADLLNPVSRQPFADSKAISEYFSMALE